jgi:hypothetical protein
MLNHKGNLIISIVKSVFTTVHLALISTGLVGCVVEAPQPSAPTEQLPAVQPKQQPNQTKQNDHDNDKDHNSDDDKDDKD